MECIDWVNLGLVMVPAVAFFIFLATLEFLIGLVVRIWRRINQLFAGRTVGRQSRRTACDQPETHLGLDADWVVQTGAEEVEGPDDLSRAA